jgi:hypothetical protein
MILQRSYASLVHMVIVGGTQMPLPIRCLNTFPVARAIDSS